MSSISICGAVDSYPIRMVNGKMSKTKGRSRWETESTFFDEVATHGSEIGPFDILTLERYSKASLRRRFSKEFRFGILGDLRNKSVLDVGCGDGENSVLLAKLGANVTGIDISSKAIERAKKRADMSEVGEFVRFVCSPLEIATIRSHSFDVIWGDGILHHVIDNLELLLQRLILWAKPGARMVFAEPVNFNNTLRQLRFMVPVKTDATPDERPLEPAESDMLRRYVPDLRIRSFSLLGRLDRFILIDRNYERSPFVRRMFANAIACTDSILLSLPFIRDMGGTAVFYGHAPDEAVASPE